MKVMFNVKIIMLLVLNLQGGGELQFVVRKVNTGP